VTFSVIQELIHRDGLRTALAGRDDVLLEPILRLLVKHVDDPRFGEMACDVSGVLIGEYPFCTSFFDTASYFLFIYTDMYSSVVRQSPVIDSLFIRLRKKVIQELKFQCELLKARGALEMVLASAALAAT
jgi:U3 small nucleolar RNA-associated protein 15